MSEQKVPDCQNQIKIKAPPVGKPDVEKNFEFVKVEKPDFSVPEKSGKVLVEMEYVSVDPYLRFRFEQFMATPLKQMVSHGVAKVLKSGSDKCAAGDYVYGVFPWSDVQVVDDKFIMSKAPVDLSKYDPKADPDYRPEMDDEAKFDLKDIETKIPRSYYIGSYGMPGQTAYYGLVEKAEVKKGQNVLVSGAAGAVGSIVGQIAKAVFDCHTVGIAGSPEKLKWLTDDLGFDAVINYKEYGDDYDKAQAALKERFPKGIDIYFDNVGGVFTEAVWDLLNPGATVIVCGQIASYNDVNPKLIRPFLFKTIYKEVRILGIIQPNFKNLPKFYYDMGRWISSGKIKVKETTVEGFNKIPEAFVGLFTGQNIGKMVIKCTK